MCTRLPALVIVAAALLIAGCGDGSKNAGSSGTGTIAAGATTTGSVSSDSVAPLSISRSVAQADEICKRLNTELDSPRYNARTAQDVLSIGRRRAAAQQAALAELSRLELPSSMVRDYQKILAIRRVLIKDTIKLGEDAAANNHAEARLFDSSAILIGKMASLARRNGLKYCGAVG